MRSAIKHAKHVAFFLTLGVCFPDHVAERGNSGHHGLWWKGYSHALQGFPCNCFVKAQRGQRIHWKALACDTHRHTFLCLALLPSLRDTQLCWSAERQNRQQHSSKTWLRMLCSYPVVKSHFTPSVKHLGALIMYVLLTF